MFSVLVIDDDPAILEMLQDLFEEADFTVSTAENGKVGLEKFRATPTDLIVTDIIMPESEGIETIQAIKQIQPDIKIIAVSGGGREGPDDYLKLAEMLGADATFTKPFNWDELLAKSQSLLN